VEKLCPTSTACFRYRKSFIFKQMVGAGRFELPTSCTPSKRASRTTLRPEPFILLDIIVIFQSVTCVFYTVGMRTNSSETTDSRWQKTPVVNLVRHVQSENYYARIRVRGKLIWKSLKTNRISAAKLRLGIFTRRKQRAATQAAVARGKMTFGDALEAYRQKLQNDPNIKPKAKEYYEFRIYALLESWPPLKNKDVSKISSSECGSWSISNREIQPDILHSMAGFRTRALPHHSFHPALVLKTGHSVRDVTKIYCMSRYSNYWPAHSLPRQR
jgi:hypothetical protein